MIGIEVSDSMCVKEPGLLRSEYEERKLLIQDVYYLDEIKKASGDPFNDLDDDVVISTHNPNSKMRNAS
jgi:hypothetical protein